MKFSDELRQRRAKLRNELQGMMKDDAATAEQIEAKTAEIAAVSAKLTAQLAIEAEEENAMKSSGTAQPVDTGSEPAPEAVYEDAFYNMLAGKPLTDAQSASLLKVNNALSSSSGADGGYLIPADQQVAIRELKRQFQPLEELVTVEPVSTLTGSRNMEKDAQYTPFTEFTEDGDVPASDAPQFANITYAIKDRGGILPVPNNLLADNKANLQGYLNAWLAKKQVATRNKLIVDLLNTKTKDTIAGVDDVKDILNVTLDPAISAMATVIMNQDAFNKFDKMKDSDGNYLLQPDPTNPTQKQLCGRPVRVYSNKVLPTRTAETKKLAPVIIGSLKEAVVLFDRQAMSLLATNIGGTAFGKNRTEIRAITREDIKEFDLGAVVFGEIEVQ